MREYDYTIEEMMQIIADFNKREKIIAEYKEIEGIDIITEEEMTNLFGTTFFYSYVYANVHYFGHYDLSMYISDYDQYLIDNGYDPFLADFIDNLEESYVVPWIDLYESLTLEDNYSCKEIDVDDFIFKLVSELKNRLDQAKTRSHQGNNATIAQKYEKWISILNYIDGFITPQELDVLAECISTYATVCCPYERRKEIRRNLLYQNSIFDIDLLEFESKIYRIDAQVLYELTEILLELADQFHCTSNSDSNPHSSTEKRDWPISTFYYCWEVLDFDRIHMYEMEYEITAADCGLIKDIWNSDHVFPYGDSINGNHIEYDYYINQFIDNDQERIDKIDIGDLECLTEDDLFKDTWLVAGMKFPNYIDYFWEAEITNLCQTQAGDFYTDFRNSFSEQGFWNYSKYLCYQGDSGFYYCDKNSCKGCRHNCSKKVLNEQYVLWQKYVQPIELDIH